ncbi:MAG: hypothetical protein ACI9WS_000760 [Paraglaciecola psychrophila]|jgi:uncharacterized protein (TIGR00369 family)
MKFTAGDEKLPPVIASVIKNPSAPSTYLGWEFVDADDEAGTATIAFNTTAQVCNKWGGIHGGMVSAMLDDVLSAAIGLKVEWGEIMPTLEMKTSFISAGKPGRLIGKGRLIKRGKSIGFAEASLYNEDGSLMATATCTSSFVKLKKKET